MTHYILGYLVKWVKIISAIKWQSPSCRQLWAGIKLTQFHQHLRTQSHKRREVQRALISSGISIHQSTMWISSLVTYNSCQKSLYSQEESCFTPFPLTTGLGFYEAAIFSHQFQLLICFFSITIDKSTKIYKLYAYIYILIKLDSQKPLFLEKWACVQFILILV